MEVKISPKVYVIFRVQYSSISAGENTNRTLHNLWRNGLVVRIQVYQTKDPRFKTIRWLKNCLCISSFKGQSNEYQGFLETWWLKVSPHCGSAVYRQLNSIHKVVHWDKWTLKRDYDFFVKYTWSILQVYFEFTLKYWLNFTKCALNVLLLSKWHRLEVYFFFCNATNWSILAVYLEYTWGIIGVYLKYALSVLEV